MLVYRICRAAHRALDGEGARLYGGRWNSPGRAALYASATLSLAALEYLVHVHVEDVPDDLVALTVELPDDALVDAVDAATLPSGWAAVATPAACVARGDAWLAEGRALALRVPAAPVPEESNVLVNPRHADAARVRIVAERRFFFDPRLLG